MASYTEGTHQMEPKSPDLKPRGIANRRRGAARRKIQQMQKRGESPFPEGIALADLKIAPLSVAPTKWRMRDGTNLGLLPSSPLIDHQNKLLIYWSPKSACTSVYVWFSAFAGFVDEVSRSHPHRHRILIFNKSAFYAKGLETDPDELFAVKVLRDPYARAVSIYRHALGTGFADDDIRSAYGGKLTRKEGFSFQKFLDLVVKVGFTESNPHYRPQTMRRDLIRKADYIINISKQDLFSELNAAVASRGMPPVDLGKINWLHSLEAKRKARTQTVEGENLDFQPFDRFAARGDKPFPTYEQLLTAGAKERIREIYGIDFETYGTYL